MRIHMLYVIHIIHLIFCWTITQLAVFVLYDIFIGLEPISLKFDVPISGWFDVESKVLLELYILNC